MRIYTRSGDQGYTSFIGGERISKNDPRVAAYGEIDELNALLGLCSARAEPAIAQVLDRESSQLFTMGSHLATPSSATSSANQLPSWNADCCKTLEAEMDEWDQELPELRSFILPGGCDLSAHLQLARCVCRRAERTLVGLHSDSSTEVNLDFLVYLNRLSDWLYCLARVSNHRAGRQEKIWPLQSPR